GLALGGRGGDDRVGDGGGDTGASGERVHRPRDGLACRGTRQILRGLRSLCSDCLPPRRLLSVPRRDLLGVRRPGRAQSHRKAPIRLSVAGHARTAPATTCLAENVPTNPRPPAALVAHREFPEKVPITPTCHRSRHSRQTGHRRFRRRHLPLPYPGHRWLGLLGRWLVLAVAPVTAP